MPVLSSFDNVSRNEGTFTFPRLFVAPPRLAHGIRRLELDKNYDIRVNSTISDIKNDKASYKFIAPDSSEGAPSRGVNDVFALAPSDLDFLTGEYIRDLEVYPDTPATVRINFERRFVTPPKVVVFFNRLEFDKSHGWRATTTASDIDVNGFTLTINTWSDTILNRAQSCWIAYPEDRGLIFSTSVNTTDVRARDKSQRKTENKIPLNSVEFFKTPSVFIALNSLEIGCTANLRINAYVDDVSTTNLVWHLNTSADTVLYSAGATIIAFNSPTGPPPGPPPPQGTVPYNLPNIQGDILPALPKALEYFYYFRIKDLPYFRKVFRQFILPKINTADDLVNRPPPRVNPNDPKSFDYPFLGVNVGFSYLAMKLFGLDDSLGDDAYVRGQQQDSKSLGDAGTQRGTFWTPDWDGAFKEVIHGIFLITAYNENTATTFIRELETKLLITPHRSCIDKVYMLHGYPRPGAEAMNDHFGYRGGMSNPQVAGVTFKEKMRYPGSPLIPGGVIVMGYEGDADKDKRPAWAKDGSFMVTRKLDNLVPEFDNFLLEHGPRIFSNLPKNDAALKLGARLFGRWKNGTPVELSPDNNDPSIAADDNKINNFVFDLSKQQARCPFASHMRKSNPRNDVSPVESAFKHFIRRHNMPYGTEVTDEERDGRGTISERGLHIVCYQSSITRGFKFIQEGWYNDPNFPPNKPVQPGFDPIFGQTGKEDQSVYRSMTGTNPNYEQELMSFPHKFIDPRGGEYFFAPSISTLRSYIAAE